MQSLDCAGLSGLREEWCKLRLRDIVGLREEYEPYSLREYFMNCFSKTHEERFDQTFEKFEGDRRESNSVLESHSLPCCRYTTAAIGTDGTRVVYKCNELSGLGADNFKGKGVSKSALDSCKVFLSADEEEPVGVVAKVGC